MAPSGGIAGLPSRIGPGCTGSSSASTSRCRFCGTYIAQEPEGYRYSRFCELYRGWAGKLSVTMRQSHAGGEKLFVDYAGDTVPVVVDRLTGETRRAWIFVAVLGASSFTYAEATWT